MKTLFVRINPAQKTVQKFFRCGVQFGRDWQKLEGVDDATARRLAEEQMLEVMEKQPEVPSETQAGDSADTIVPPVDLTVPPAAAPEALAEGAAPGIVAVLDPAPEVIAKVATPKAIAEVATVVAELAAPKKKAVK